MIKEARGILVELEIGCKREGGGGDEEEQEKEEYRRHSRPPGLGGGIRGRGALFSGRLFGGDGSERRGTVGSFEVGPYRV